MAYPPEFHPVLLDNLKASVDAARKLRLYFEAKKPSQPVKLILQALSNIQRAASVILENPKDTVNHDQVQHRIDGIVSFRDSIQKLNPLDLENASVKQAQSILMTCNFMLSNIQALFNESTQNDFLNASSTDEFIGEISEYSENARKEIDQILNDLKSTKISAEESLKAIRELAVASGVSSESRHFGELSKSYRIRGNSWLIAIIIFSATLAWGSYKLLFNNLPTSLSSIFEMFEKSKFDFQKINMSIIWPFLAKDWTGRLVLISIGLIILTWSIQSYKAARHNEMINSHRAAAVSTFTAFANSTTDQKTKELIILNATTLIYSPQGSGYQDSEKNSQSQSNLADLIKALSKFKAE